MAVSASPYGLFMKSLLDKLVDVDTDVIKVMLCTSAYTPNVDTHQFKSSVTNEIAASGGYTAGGFTLGSVTSTYNSSTNTLEIGAANVVVDPTTITARYAVVYDSSPSTDATRPLLGYVDFGADVISSGGPFEIQWTDGKVMTLALV